MKYLINIFLLSLVVIVSGCQSNKDNKTEKVTDVVDTIKTEDQKEIRSIGETLSPDAKQMVKDWQEYIQLDQLLTNFYSISSNEALNLSQELATTTQQLKDSLKISRFKQPDILIRINVLNNFALRLHDMSEISSIEPEEVKNEIQAILDAFSALNAKINNVVRREKLQKEIDDFEKEIITFKPKDSL